MIFTVDRIVRDVRVCLDLNRSDESLVQEEDPETLTLDEIIRSKIEEGVDYVHSLAPYDLLEQGHNFGDSDLYWRELESGFVVLPGDWLRLVVFEMSDWERPVYVPITEDSAEYKKQRSRVKALRGVAQRPVCAVVQRPEGLALEFYSCKTTDATISKAVYIPHAEIDAYGGVDISERCYRAAVYEIGVLTLVATGEADRAAAMTEQVKKELRITS
ncbi:MAG: hypothetical protein SPM02_03045 [Bacteroidales bacterium]|nr:hypothetical protein [Bacteroidales bacterium]